MFEITDLCGWILRMWFDIKDLLAMDSPQSGHFVILTKSGSRKIYLNIIFF